MCNKSWAENAKVLYDIFWHLKMLPIYIFHFCIDEHLKLIQGSKLFFPMKTNFIVCFPQFLNGDLKF